MKSARENELRKVTAWDRVGRRKALRFTGKLLRGPLESEGKEKRDDLRLGGVEGALGGCVGVLGGEGCAIAGGFLGC